VSKELRHDRHIVSLLTDHMVFSPKIQAAVKFMEQGGKRAVVCRPEGVVEALKGRDCGWEADIGLINSAYFM